MGKAARRVEGRLSLQLGKRNLGFAADDCRARCL
jgi:hypothetical protein